MELNTRYLKTISNILNSEWNNYSISVHNNIVDIRSLLSLMDLPKFKDLDTIAVKIETVSGICLGTEKRFLSDIQMENVHSLIEDMKSWISKNCDVPQDL